MEYEFKIRYAIFNGEEQGELSGGFGNRSDGGRSGAELDGGAEDIEFDLSVTGRGQRRVKRAANLETDDEVRAEPVDTAGQIPARERTESSADTSGDERDEQRTAETGWEHERRVLLKAERARELAAESKLKAVQNSDSITSAAIDTVGDIAALATLIEDSDEDEDKHYAHLDRKRLKEEWEKKESLVMHMG